MNSPAVPAPGPTSSAMPALGRQVLCCIAGALLGAALWYLLAVPQHLINVIFSVLVGVGAGLGAGRASGVARSGLAPVVAIVITAIVVVIAQGVITQQYLSWATGNLAAAPSNPDWDGPIGTLRLALDRAAGRNGWAPNASYFWWFASLAAAGTLAWYSARPARRRMR